MRTTARLIVLLIVVELSKQGSNEQSDSESTYYSAENNNEGKTSPRTASVSSIKNVPGNGDDKPTEKDHASNVKLQENDEFEDDSSSDEESSEETNVDKPEALYDKECDKLWNEAKISHAGWFRNRTLIWHNLCAMIQGKCDIPEPYWASSIFHMRITFIYKHDLLEIKTRAKTSVQERCTNPQVNWDKFGERIKPKEQIQNTKRYYKAAIKPHVGKRRHRRNQAPKKKRKLRRSKVSKR